MPRSVLDRDNHDVSPPPTQGFKGFTHISLSVSDLEASIAFYQGLLGLDVLAEPFEGTAFRGREAMLLAGRTALCLQEHRDRLDDPFDPRRPGLDHLSFAAASREDLEDFAGYLSAQSVPHSGVKPLPGYGYLIELRDPDGILVEVHALPR
jgi:glyoxylase I family protein